MQKYVSGKRKPKLDSLGSKSFQKTKAKVEKRVNDFAETLVKLYASRSYHKGYAYPKDSIWQTDFEANFPYEETPDQLSAIEDIKKDMESLDIMDRLICGDVGYGKTEVAMRAVFKAVLSAKQVAIIAPTTILALQHFNTFSTRFASYPIEIDWLSRFRSRSEANQIKEDLASGKIEIIIGTHSLLAQDIKLPNLALLVIDEEQRFGVSHKESLKKLKTTVDTITLSATPIPRTLHMSLVGARDLSVIKTPPQNRLAVKTFVLPHKDSIVKEAVYKEVERGGQVFYLHNRVVTIDSCVYHLKKILEGVSIGILHAQMREEEIENILIEFKEGRYQVLVTTTIIENGIDIANANTLIVDNAHHFGLSQLYQIRGRVGRSDRQAYAYLFYPEDAHLTEAASLRLEAIKKYQYLGSGFAIAMQDLEIRGAGNILGAEQSGHIAEVGYELYLKLLKRSIRKWKGRDKRLKGAYTNFCTSAI